MRLSVDHTLTTVLRAICHKLDIVIDVRVALVTTVLAFAVIATPSPAPAKSGSRNPSAAQIRRAVSSAERSRSLWATINICNSRRYRDTLGVRGQMPTLGFSASLSMLIGVDYYSTTSKHFVPIQSATAMRKVPLGNAASGLQQGGAVFGPFAAHTGLLDATITFTWKRAGKVLAQIERRTTAGHKDADFGSPPRFSAAQCRIS
jgi:hypothetical protein